MVGSCIVSLLATTFYAKTIVLLFRCTIFHAFLCASENFYIIPDFLYHIATPLAKLLITFKEILLLKCKVWIRYEIYFYFIIKHLEKHNRKHGLFSVEKTCNVIIYTIIRYVYIREEKQSSTLFGLNHVMYLNFSSFLLLVSRYKLR